MCVELEEKSVLRGMIGGGEIEEFSIVICIVVDDMGGVGAWMGLSS